MALFKPGDPTPIQAGVFEALATQAATSVPTTTNTFAGSGLRVYDPAPTGLLTTGNTIAIPINTLKLSMYIPRATAVSQLIDFSLQGAGTAGSKFRVGLYDINMSAGNGTLLKDFGEEDGTVIGIRSYPFSFNFIRGHIYGLAYLCGVAAPTLQVTNSVVGQYFSYSGEGWCGFECSQAYGALPATTPALNIRAASHVLPIIMVGY